MQTEIDEKYTTQIKTNYELLITFHTRVRNNILRNNIS